MQTDSNYFEIGVFQPKREHNVGTLWRSALQLGAAGVFTIGRRYKYQTSDTFRTGEAIPLRHYLTFDEFWQNRPADLPIVAIEMGGLSLGQFQHPPAALYLLGAEDNGLPEAILQRCDLRVSLEAVRAQRSYNVAVAGSIVLYHRCFLQKPFE